MRQEYLQQCFQYFGVSRIHGSRKGVRSILSRNFIDHAYLLQVYENAQGRRAPDLDIEEIHIFDIDIDFIRTITLQDVYEYMSYAKNRRGNNARALARKACSLGVFFKYLTNYTRQLDVNPFLTLIPQRQKNPCRNI